ncbi:MAG: 4-hydroxyphenylpyruvate dioxygenase, partial [Gemmatimonadetes bacterium]|nr:4-hydroxyphenylpyruvate dioxygenase [Gemmatimonadota bacterium]
MATSTLEVAAPAHDTFPINGTDYIEFYVGNAKQAAQYYRSAFGFQLVAYRGPETGVRDRASYLLQQGKIRFVLTTAIRPDLSPDAERIATHVHEHGDGVRDIALWVDDTRDAFAKAVERGARAEQAPTVLHDDDGEIVIASFRIYGETVHSLVERKNYRGLFMPGYVAVKPHYAPPEVGLQYVDHCVGNVELGKMNEWVEFYAHVMGFRNLLTFDDKTISTE